jgi:hypothetical protein
MEDNCRPDLELFDTEELVSELASRFGAMLFTAERAAEEGEGRSENLLRWRGAASQALGLIELARFRIITAVAEQEAGG